MKPTYEGFEAKKHSNFAQLPVPGAYVAEIQGVRLEPSYDNTRDMIVLMLEITEGEYAGQYHKVFEEQQNSFGKDVKYRGVLRLKPPIASDEPWVKNRFEGNIFCVQDSNPGYRWDWDEKKLVGKKVGISIRKSLYTGADGSDKETTEIFQLETVNDVRDGKCKIAKPRDSRKKTDKTPSFTEVSGAIDVPF